MKRTVVLLIIDGWGIGENNQTNPLTVAKPKLLSFLPNYYLSGALEASGISVGLPWAEESSSEVGHLTIGSGRIIYQHLLRINNAIEDGGFFKNPVLLDAIAHAKKNNSTLHLAGLLTEGNVHAHLDHLQALIKAATDASTPHIALHLFTDGKDSSPISAMGLLKNIDPRLVASISGRYYAMDRDNHWERTERAYKTLVGNGQISSDVVEEIKKNYERGMTDEYIQPFLVGPNSRPIQNNDAIVFFNFREDSMRQLVEVFIAPIFEKFPRKKIENLLIATMTRYADSFSVPVLFPSAEIRNTLGEILATNQKKQLRIAETVKYAHVTYFFNAYREEPLPGEFRVLIPSQNVARYDERPEMRTPEIADRLVAALKEQVYDLIVVNIASFDMIAHTGNFDAALKAIDIVDKNLEKIWQAVIENNAIMVLTADHGNIEVMLDSKKWLPETKHNQSSVPFYVVGSGFESIEEEKKLNQVGLLSDVAPTILHLLRIPPPPEMSGQNLLPNLK